MRNACQRLEGDGARTLQRRSRTRSQDEGLHHLLHLEIAGSDVDGHQPGLAVIEEGNHLLDDRLALLDTIHQHVATQGQDVGRVRGIDDSHAL